MKRSRAVGALLTALIFVGCGSDEGPQQGSAESATTVAAPNAEPTEATTPYFLLDADGWELETGVSSGPVIEASGPLGLKWSVNYVNRPNPNQDIPAALGVSDPPNGDDAEGFAALLTGGDARRTTVGGREAFAGEERRTDGSSVASHVVWDEGGFVVSLTVYEVSVAEATALAAKVSEVSKEQWDSTTQAANERTRANAS